MVTCYPGGGARYMKHVDTMASSNRVLTAICYLNEDWVPAHGGQLRLHLPTGPCDVEPLMGRLLLFWSDKRCPHEVLPSFRVRYAATMWFFDPKAKKKDANEAIESSKFPSGWHDYVQRCRQQYQGRDKKTRQGLEVCLERIAANADAVGEMQGYAWHKMQVPDDATVRMFGQ